MHNKTDHMYDQMISELLVRPFIEVLSQLKGL